MKPLQPSYLARLFLVTALSLLVATGAAQNFAQSEPTSQTVVVLPFSAGSNASPYGAGLATAIQRSLNVIDGVYAPPVGDTLFVTRRLENEGRLDAANVAGAYDAVAVVSGQVAATGNAAEIRLGFASGDFGTVRDVVVQSNLNQPQQLVSQVVNAVVRELGLRVSGQDRRELDEVLLQTPSLPSLTNVAQATLRLQAPDLTGLQAAASLDSSSSWVLSEYARALALEGNTPAALDASLRAIQVSPSDVEALVIRSVILRSSGDEATALQGFNAAVALNPSHALALTGRAQLLGDPAAARAALETALDIDPRLGDAYLALATILQQQNPQGREALQTVREGARRIPGSVALHRAVVSESLRLGDPGGAYAYLNDFLANNPDTNPGVYALAAALPSDQGFADAALALVQQGYIRYPSNPVLARAEAALLEDRGDLAGAENALRQALDANPNDATLLNQLAVFQAEQGRLDEAQATLEASTEQDLTLRLNLAQIYLEAGQSEAAVGVLEPLLTRYPQEAELYSLYGIALGRSGRYDQALNALDRALELEPDFEQARRAQNVIAQNRNLTGGDQIALAESAGQFFEAGLAALEAGNYPEAVAQFSQARQQDDSGVVAFYQAYAQQLSGDIRQAAEGYERALEELPDNPTVLNNLGFAYYRLGRFDRALPYLERAVAADADNVEAQLNYGLVNYDLGRYGAAVTPLERVLALQPSLGDQQVNTGTAVMTLRELVEDARRQSQ